MRNRSRNQADTGYSAVRRTFLKLIPTALTARLLSAQSLGNPNPYDSSAPLTGSGEPPPAVIHPTQRRGIALAEYQQNLKDASDLIDLAKQFKLGLEKSGPSVFSLDSVKEFDDIEKIAKRIHKRIHR